MLFGLWGRFLILVFGGFMVILAVVIVTCFVGPGCWGFEYLLNKERKKQMDEEIIGKIPALMEKPKIPHICENGSNFWMGNGDLIVYQAGLNGMEKKKNSKAEEASAYYTKEKIFNLRCTPLLAVQNLYMKGQNSNPRLKVNIFYALLKANDEMGRLSVQVVSATSLITRDYSSTLDPFVSLDIYQSKWPFQKNEVAVHNVQTRVVKDAINPDFDQTFTFDGMKREIKNWYLRFTIVDYDRLTRIRPLYENVVYIRDLKNLTGEGSATLNLDMRETTKNIGTLLFGIRYMPTAQRFNINIIKAAKLKYQNHAPSLLEFYPYVRVIMLNNNGKYIKKKKTSFKQGEFSPIFNQSLIFDTSVGDIEQTIFLILLCTKLMNRTPSLDESSSIDGDIEQALKESRDKVLGMTVIGRNVKCLRARNHWVTVMQNPRKMISVWHELR